MKDLEKTITLISLTRVVGHRLLHGRGMKCHFWPSLDLFHGFYFTLDDTLLELTLILMLRYLIFSCFLWVGWVGVGIILNMSLAPLLDLRVHLTLCYLILPYP